MAISNLDLNSAYNP